MIFIVVEVSFLNINLLLDQLAQSMPQLPNANQRGRAPANQGGGAFPLKEDPSRVTISRMKSSYGDELKKQMEEDKRK